jgi:thiamine biosynthesis protein ThiI
MRKLILIRYGEIALKKQNRNFFINTLIRNIQYALSEYQNVHCEKIQGRILVEDYDPHDETDILLHLQKVFGIVSVTKAVELEANLENIKEAALELIRDKHNITFKVESKRGDKSFPYQSPEISRQVGAYILINTNDITVDVHHPDVLMMIEVRKKLTSIMKTYRVKQAFPLVPAGGEDFYFPAGSTALLRDI